MTHKRRSQLVPAVLTLALVACEESISGIPELVVDAAPSVEAVTSVAPVTSGVCDVPDLISWWPGDGNFDDVYGSNPTVTTEGDRVTFEQGIRSQGFRFHGDSQMEIDGSDHTLEPEAFTIDFWAERLGDGQNSGDEFGNILIQKAIDGSLDPPPPTPDTLIQHWLDWRRGRG